jgi:hypothetical protein
VEEVVAAPAVTVEPGERASSASVTRQRPSTYRARRRGRTRRPATRTVVRTVGVTLPQLRTELGRLETGLGARVQRVEKAVSRPAAPPRVVVAPPAAPPTPPTRNTLPVAPALWVALLSGVLGFALGQRWGGRTALSRRSEEPRPSWAQIRQRLDATQQRLSLARARIRRLEQR